MEFRTYPLNLCGFQEVCWEHGFGVHLASVGCELKKPKWKILFSCVI